MPILKNNFLTSVLLGVISDSNEIDKRLSYYGINLPADGYYLVCLIFLENYSRSV